MDRYNELTNSVSFKLGRAITFIPRKIRDSFRGKKKNGEERKNDRAGDVASSGRVGRVLERKARGASCVYVKRGGRPKGNARRGRDVVNGARNVTGNVITFMSF